MAKKLKTEKSSILQNFRTVFDKAVKKMSFKLGLRKSKVPKRSNDMSPAESDCDINASVESQDSSHFHESEILAVEWSDEVIYGEYESTRVLYETSYEEYYHSYGGSWNDSSRSCTKKKRWPSVGSNFAKIPVLSEIPKIINPAGWVSSKTQKDTKPIKN